MKNIIKLFALYAFFLIALDVIFKDGIKNIFLLTTIFFWLFVLPGYLLIERESFTEKIILGTILSFLISIPIYYLGLLGLHLKWFLTYPILIIIYATWRTYGKNINNTTSIQ